jgi:NADH-quinone oxidoreductase subunit F
MNRLQSMTDFENWQATTIAASDPNRPFITVCGGTGCRVYGSAKVWETFRAELVRQGVNAALDYEVRVTGCHGFCERGPLVVIRPQGIFYSHVKAEDVPEIVSETVLGGKIIERLLYIDPLSGDKIEHEQDVPFYKHQQRLVLEQNGNLDPAQIDEYIACGGYASLAKVLTSWAPEQVISAIKASGLRGRGGLLHRYQMGALLREC